MAECTFKRLVLDHGYVLGVERWGSDEAIIEAARMSTQKGFLGWEPRPCPTCTDPMTRRIVPGSTCVLCDGKATIPGDAKLLRYLNEHRHHTPFEFAGLTIEVQAPIFVFREWHRHRTQSYNEMSARYAPLPDLSYVPTLPRLFEGGGHLTKQAAAAPGARELTEDTAAAFRNTLELHYRLVEKLYQEALLVGVPKELARVVLPVARYSRMRASANLRNWLAFLTLRNDPHAQWEIRQYAQAVTMLLEQEFPRTMSLYIQQRRVEVSRKKAWRSIRDWFLEGTNEHAAKRNVERAFQYESGNPEDREIDRSYPDGSIV